VARKKNPSLGAVMVLHALARGFVYGFDIMEETGLTSGTVYPALDRLEVLGFARSEWEDARIAQAEKRPPRRYFRITPDGSGKRKGPRRYSSGPWGRFNMLGTHFGRNTPWI
jgi:PadR family transcriptional regulator PadR